MAQAQVTPQRPARAPLQPDRIGQRITAAGAGVAILVGVVTMTIGLITAPGPWTAGYVSEAGAAGMPAATAYRIGVGVLAAGIVALGAALARPVRPAALLGVSGVLAGTSGTVPCSARCPLPPYEAATRSDLIHGAASILAMAALAFTMVMIARAAATGVALRRWSVLGAAATFPLAGVMALAMLVGGRTPVTSAVERVLLAVAACWLVGAAALLAARRRD